MFTIINSKTFCKCFFRLWQPRQQQQQQQLDWYSAFAEILCDAHISSAALLCPFTIRRSLMRIKLFFSSANIVQLSRLNSIERVKETVLFVCNFRFNAWSQPFFPLHGSHIYLDICESANARAFQHCRDTLKGAKQKYTKKKREDNVQ